MKYMIKHPIVQIIAKEQAQLGIDLAHKANNALSRANELAAARNEVLYPSDHVDERYTWNQEFYQQQAVDTEAHAYRDAYHELTMAAGALIGRHTFGGDYIAVMNGDEQTFASDGSYRSGSAN